MPIWLYSYYLKIHIFGDFEMFTLLNAKLTYSCESIFGFYIIFNLAIYSCANISLFYLQQSYMLIGKSMIILFYNILFPGYSYLFLHTNFKVTLSGSRKKKKNIFKNWNPVTFKNSERFDISIILNLSDKNIYIFPFLKIYSVYFIVL